MIKKQVEETKVIKHDVYMSADGKEFSNENDCREWEKSYIGTLEISMKNIKKIETSSCAIREEYSSDDDEVWLVKPKNLDEVTLLNAYTEAVTGCKPVITAQMIGKVLSINFGYDRTWCGVHVLEDYLKVIEKEFAEMIGKFDEEDEK